MDAERIRDFLVEDLHFGVPRSELTGDFPLIEARVIDSMGLLRLVAWLESTFGIEIADAEVVPVNFSTIDAIASLLGSKATEHQSPPRQA